MKRQVLISKIENSDNVISPYLICKIIGIGNLYRNLGYRKTHPIEMVLGHYTNLCLIEYCLLVSLFANWQEIEKVAKDT